MNWVITDIWPIQVLCKVNQYGLATGQLSTLTDSRNLFVEPRPKKRFYSLSRLHYLFLCPPLFILMASLLSMLKVGYNFI